MTTTTKLLTDDDLAPEETASEPLEAMVPATAAEIAFTLRQREAKALAASDLIPGNFQGTSSTAIANVMVAMEMATRMNASVLMVMQNLHVIHGRPGWSAQFLIATFNASGRFTAIKYRFNDDRTACKAVTTEKETGEVLEGTEITMAMADAEGWSKKAGSKWKTMPEQMLCYRAAAFLIRAVAPEIGLGLYTADELKDISKDD